MTRDNEAALFSAMLRQSDGKPHVPLDMRAIIGAMPAELQKPAWRTLEKWDRQGFLEYGTSIAVPWFKVVPVELGKRLGVEVAS